MDNKPKYEYVEPKAGNTYSYIHIAADGTTTEPTFAGKFVEPKRGTWGGDYGWGQWVFELNGKENIVDTHKKGYKMIGFLLQ